MNDPSTTAIQEDIIDIVSNLTELNMENDDGFDNGDADFVSDHMVW